MHSIAIMPKKLKTCPLCGNHAKTWQIFPKIGKNNQQFKNNDTFCLANVNDTFHLAKVNNTFNLANVNDTFHLANVNNTFHLANVNDTFHLANVNDTFHSRECEQYFPFPRM